MFIDDKKLILQTTLSQTYLLKCPYPYLLIIHFIYYGTIYIPFIQNLQVKPDLYDWLDLTPEGNTVTTSKENSISYENCYTNAADNLEGEYSSLHGVPKVSLQEEKNAIRAEILKNVMVRETSRIVINSRPDRAANIGNDGVYTGGFTRKQAKNSHIILL